MKSIKTLRILYGQKVLGKTLLTSYLKTPIGKTFKRWLLMLYEKKQFPLSEEQLTYLDQLLKKYEKQKNIHGIKDIMTLKSVKDLERVVLGLGSLQIPMQGHFHFKGRSFTPEIIVNDPPYRVYRVSSNQKDAAAILEELGRGTTWCTRGDYDANGHGTAAQHYLDTMGTVFIIYKNGNPYVQAGGSQLLDVNNKNLESSLDVQQLRELRDLFDEPELDSLQTLLCSDIYDTNLRDEVYSDFSQNASSYEEYVSGESSKPAKRSSQGHRSRRPDFGPSPVMIQHVIGDIRRYMAEIPRNIKKRDILKTIIATLIRDFYNAPEIFRLWDDYEIKWRLNWMDNSSQLREFWNLSFSQQSKNYILNVFKNQGCDKGRSILNEMIDESKQFLDRVLVTCPELRIY